MEDIVIRLCYPNVTDWRHVDTFLESDTINITLWNSYRLKLIKGSLYNLWLLLLFTFCSVRFLFQLVYIINVKFSKMMHQEILSEEFFSELYANAFSDWVTYILVSEKMTVLQNIFLIQTMWTSLEIDSDTESENETQCWRMPLCIYRRVGWRLFHGN